uniref:Sodium:proton antiporter n=1 Tax=Panagrellus redivivus TaxID=6233 RepID=A0A7E4UWN2_PANRE
MELERNDYILFPIAIGFILVCWSFAPIKVLVVAVSAILAGHGMAMLLQTTAQKIQKGIAASGLSEYSTDAFNMF